MRFAPNDCSGDYVVGQLYYWLRGVDNSDPQLSMWRYQGIAPNCSTRCTRRDTMLLFQHELNDGSITRAGRFEYRYARETLLDSEGLAKALAAAQVCAAIRADTVHSTPKKSLTCPLPQSPRESFLIRSSLDIAALEAATSVESIILLYAPSLIDMQRIAQCATVRSIVMGHPDVNDVTILPLGNMEQLEWLNLENTSVSGRASSPLSCLHNLRTLRANGSSMSDDIGEAIQCWPHLVGLRLADTLISSSIAMSLDGCVALEDVDVSGTTCCWRVIERIASHPLASANVAFIPVAQGLQVFVQGSSKHLRFLNLAFTDVTDAHLDVLSELRGLRYLNVRGTAVSVEGIEQLQRALLQCHIFV